MRTTLLSFLAILWALAPGHRDSAQARGFGDADTVREAQIHNGPARDAPSPARQRALRPDDSRPEDQLTIQLFGRPLTVGGEYNLILDHRGDFALRESAKDDLFRIDQSLELEFLYSLWGNTALFAEVKPFYNAIVSAGGGDRGIERGVRRGETWIHIDRIFGSRFSVQAGRQSFDEKREWWWDEDLDALRLYYNAESWRLEIGVAQELAPTSTDDAGIDPDHEDVLRLLGRATWNWAPKHRAELFFLVQQDHSVTEAEGDVVRRDRKDESDADLAWIGARAMGRTKFRSLGRLDYWLDTALVAGNERLVDFDRLDGKRRIAASVTRQAVRGWAVDTGVTWRTRWRGRPSLTLGYAVGSGDGNPDDGTDHAFRQTGLQDNNGRFRGVDSFRYYGELLRPELSNLHIFTASLGFPLLRQSSVEFSYHWYGQVRAADGLRNARITDDPLGRNRAIGQELDVVIGLEEWKHWESEVVGGIFVAGDAYGPQAGEAASNVLFKLTYNF